MNLSLIYSADPGYGLFAIREGYGRTHGFRYDNFDVDPRPSVLLLGRWRHPRTRNNLVGGINLNYLSDEEIETVRRSLTDILRSGRQLKSRYWAGKELIPDIFDKAYRTYDSKYVHAVTPGTLRIWSKTAEREKQSREKEQAAKQQQLATMARDKVPVAPEPQPEMPVPEPQPEPAAPPETAQQRRQRERLEAERRNQQRGTAQSKAGTGLEFLREPGEEQEPEEPEE